MPIRKPWTVLAYMVAEDPREGFPLDPVANDEKDRLLNFAEENSDQLHLALQVDFATREGVLRQIAGRRAEKRSESIASDPRVLTQFFDWALENCPADRHLLLFWGHSFGPAGMFPDGTPGNSTLEETLSLSELSSSLRQACRTIADNGGEGKFDILLFKNCCIATLETAYELYGSASYMIASQGIVPVKGWPYETMLAQLDARPVPSVARDILEELATFYEAPENLGDQEEVSYSLIDVDSAPVVVHPLGSLVDELISARRRRSIASRAALLEASHASPGDAALLDVGVMCSELAQVDGRLAAVAADLDDAVRQLVVDHRPGDSRLLQGASIFYFPGDPEIRLKSIVAPVIFAGDYHRLRLSIDADWDRIACELMPDIELLDRFSEGREAMPRDGDDKGSGFGPLTNAADQVMFDIRKLQQFLGRLAAAVNQSDSRDGVLQDFKSRQGTGVRSLVADLQDVASNLRANMEVLQAVIEKREPATDRYVVDRRTHGPAGQRGSANRRERPNVPMPHASDVRLGDLVVHVERAG